MHNMQNSLKSLVKKLLTAGVALALVLQPMVVAADEVSDAWLQLINSGAASGTSSSTLAYAQVSNVSASKWKIVPPEVTTISYTLSAYAANLKVTVKSNNGAVLATLYDSFQNAGTKQVYWGGTYPNGVVFPVGSVKVEVRATSNLGEVSTVSTPIYIVPVGNASPVITNATANPSAFSSGGSSLIAFSVNTTSLVKMSIMPVGYTSSTPIIYEQETSFLSSGSSSFTWDGRDKNGAFVSSGDYLAVLVAANDKGYIIQNVPVRFGAAVGGGSVMTVKPNLTIFDLAPNPFNSVTQNLTVKFNMDAQADLTLIVKNQQGGTVFTQTRPSSLSKAGFNELQWNGQVFSAADAGTNSIYAKNGIYTVQVASQNSAGSANDVRTFEVIGNPSTTTVIAQPGYLSNVTFSSSPFYVVNTNATIGFNLSAASNVSFAIFDAQGMEVYSSVGFAKSAGQNYITYNGSNSKTGTLLQTGTYTYYLYSYDTNKNLIDSKSGTFQAVNTGTTQVQNPMLSGVSFSPSPFNPNMQNATIGFTLSVGGNVNYQIFNAQGTEVYTSSQVVKSAGINSLVYPGYKNTGGYLDTGSYTYRVTSYTTSGAVADSSTGSFQVSVASSDKTPFITTQSFSPANIDLAANTNATIAFVLQNPGYITFTVQDSSNNTVYTMPSTSGNVYSANQTHTLTYAAVRDNGTKLSVGNYSYTLRATATDGSGKFDTKTGSFSVINNYQVVGDVITSYSFSPSSFDPSTTSATVAFNLQTPVFVVFRVEDANLATRYEKSLFFGSGNNSFFYNGRDNNGNMLPSGTYTYKLLVFKSNGAFEAKQGTFSLTTSGGGSSGSVPAILSSYATPDPYNPYGGPLTVNYTVSTSSYVTALLLQDNNIVKTLKINQLENGNKSVAWDGKLMSGDLAPAGNYKFRVSAYNSFGQSNIAEGSFKLTYSASGQTSACAGFVDVPSSSPYCAAIEEMKKLGVFSGYSDGSFRPTNAINRAETVKVILLALKYNVPTTGWWFDSAGFKDVKSTEWFTPYLAAARLYGIINGYPDNTFRAANTVNRVEMLKIFIEAANIGSKYIKCEKPYKENTGAKWYTKYACIASQYSLVDSDDGNLLPGKEMTRGDVAVMIYRAQILGLLGKLPPRSQIDFTKLPALSAIPMNPLYPGYPAGYNPPPAFLPNY